MVIQTKWRVWPMESLFFKWFSIDKTYSLLSCKTSYRRMATRHPARGLRSSVEHHKVLLRGSVKFLALLYILSRYAYVDPFTKLFITPLWCYNDKKATKPPKLLKTVTWKRARIRISSVERFWSVNQSITVICITWILLGDVMMEKGVLGWVKNISLRRIYCCENPVTTKKEIVVLCISFHLVVNPERFLVFIKNRYYSVKWFCM